MRPITVVAGVACFLVASGCCPGGVTVLESLTLPEPEQSDGCRLAELPSDGGFYGLPEMSSNPAVVSGGDVVQAAGGVILPDGGAPGGEDGIRSAYVAAYCGRDGAPGVVVHAVLFHEPTDSDRSARLETNEREVLYKGQLAAVVSLEDEECGDCYDAVLSRVRAILAR